MPALASHRPSRLPALWQMDEKLPDGAAKHLGEKATEGTVKL